MPAIFTRPFTSTVVKILNKESVVAKDTRKTALITGASSGIGEAFARLLATEGFNVVLVARREERLVALGKELEDAHGIKAMPLIADLSDPAAPLDIFNTTKEWNLDIDMLVNNAGYGVSGKFSESQYSSNSDMIQVMITGLTDLARLFVEPMLARGRGGILNVSSIGALLNVPSFTVYAATKAYVTAFTSMLVTELDGTGVRATVLMPGNTKSEWAAVAGVPNAKGVKYMGMSAKKVAEIGYEAYMKGKPSVIAGCHNRVFVSLMRALPSCVSNRVLKFATS